MRHLSRAIIAAGVLGSSLALAGGDYKHKHSTTIKQSDQQAAQQLETRYQELPDGYIKQVETKPGQTPKVTVTVEQKGWKQWAQAQRQEVDRAKAEAAAANQRAQALEAQFAELQSRQATQELQGVAEVKQDERGLILTLTGGVLFKSDSAELLPNAKERLATVAEVLKQAPDATFTVEGHTDSQGPEEYNQELSERRADSVKDYLVSKGLSEENIETVGRGEEQSIASNSSPEGRANNRRVEVVLPEGALGIGGSGEGKQQEPAPDPNKEME